MHDHHDTLGLRRDASSEEITKAYRRLAMRWHPDRHPNAGDKAHAETKFKEIKRAYEALIATAGSGSSSSYQSQSHQASWEEALRRQRQEEQQRQEEREKEQKRRHEAWKFEHRGKDIKVKIGVTISDLLRDEPVDIELASNEYCPDCCTGDGVIEPELCPRCFGSGVTDSGRNCRRCDAFGTVCARCKNLFVMEARRTLKIKLPAGVADGTVLTVKGRGKLPTDVDYSEAGRGDLIISLFIKMPPGWKAKGHDLYGTVKLTVTQALLGGSTRITLPTGKEIELDFPPRSNTGRKFRLAGIGLPTATPGEYGMVILSVIIVLPATKQKISPEFAAALRALDSV